MPRQWMLAAAISLCGCAASNGPAAVLPIGQPGDQGQGAAADMASVYDRLCFQAFPDETVLDRDLRAYGAQLLGFSDVVAILHADPGRGWRFATPTARYVLTIEDPPIHTCALRRMTREGFSTAMPYVAAMKAYAANHLLSVGPLQQLNPQLPGGASVQLLGSPLMRAGQPAPAESSLYITTNYHGRVDVARYPEASGGVGVEVRMAHQILRQQGT